MAKARMAEYTTQAQETEGNAGGGADGCARSAVPLPRVHCAGGHATPAHRRKWALNPRCKGVSATARSRNSVHALWGFGAPTCLQTHPSRSVTRRRR